MTDPSLTLRVTRMGNRLSPKSKKINPCKSKVRETPPSIVIPAKAGIEIQLILDPRFRGDDTKCISLKLGRNLLLNIAD